MQAKKSAAGVFALRTADWNRFLFSFVSRNEFSFSGDAGDLQNILGNMSQQQLMQLLGGMGMGGGGGGGLSGLSQLMGARPSSSASDSNP